VPTSAPVEGAVKNGVMERFMINRRMFAGGLAAVFSLSMPSAVTARADAPDPAVLEVQGLCDALLDVMKHAKELGVKGRYEKLRPIVERTFDFAAMLKVIVGAKWDATPAADQQELIRAFERKTIAEYASNFDGFNGEKFVVNPVPVARGADKFVLTKLVATDQTVALNYRMRQTGGSWKIVDVYLKGSISQLGKQSEDSAAALEKGGPKELAKLLNAGADKMMQ
jgi:phospholipid transport system substrate-binding protein